MLKEREEKKEQSSLLTVLGEFPSSGVLTEVLLGPLALLQRLTHCRFITLLYSGKQASVLVLLSPEL